MDFGPRDGPHIPNAFIRQHIKLTITRPHVCGELTTDGDTIDIFAIVIFGILRHSLGSQAMRESSQLSDGSCFEKVQNDGLILKNYNQVEPILRKISVGVVDSRQMKRFHFRSIKGIPPGNCVLAY